MRERGQALEVEGLYGAAPFRKGEAADTPHPHQVQQGGEAVLGHRAVRHVHSRQVTQLQISWRQQAVIRRENIDT